MANELVFKSLGDMVLHCVKLSVPDLAKLLGVSIAELQHPNTKRQTSARKGLLTLLARQFQKECGLPVTEADVANALDSIKPKKPR